MEKKVAILLTAMTIIINIFLYIYINQHMIDKLLYDKTTVSFKIYDGEHLSDILSKVNEFSKTNNIEIAQYSFLSSNKADIYTTLKETYEEALVVPNLFSDRKIKVHDFEELLNIGFKSLLYIDTEDENDTAFKLAEKKYNILKKKESDKYKLSQKLFRFLLSKGYDYDCCNSIVRRLTNNEYME